MTHELIYTSAPQGLKPGSQGFCTVVSTDGMAKSLSERLESLSGYRHAFMDQEGHTAQNPVNYGHCRISVSGRTYHVLSRVCDAGLDYTQRTNKLAHHVALEPQEAAAAIGGPAWVLAREGFCVAAWDGTVRTLSLGRQPPADDCPAGVCRAWERLTGDAGWAGVLAETASQASQVMSIIFSPGTDTLTLVVEALSLLPPERRWAVTFSTYFTQAQAGVDCQWRFLLDGTVEATAIRRDARARIIDLTKPLGAATGGDLVNLARTGVPTRRTESARGPAQRVAAERARPVLPGTAGRLTAKADEPSAYQRKPPAASVPDDGLAPVRHVAPAWAARGRTQTIWKIAAAVLAAATIAAGAFLIGAILGRTQSVADKNPSPKPAVTKPAVTEPAVTEPEPQPPAEYNPADLLPENLRREAEQAEAMPEATVEGVGFEPAPPVESAPPPPPPQPERPPVFADLQQRQNRLELPPERLSSGGAFGHGQLNTKPQLLTRLHVDDAKQCELRIEGQEFKPRAGLMYRVDVLDGDGERRWNLVSKQEHESVAKPTVWAEFRLKDEALTFQWKSTSPIRLQFCTLTVSVGDQTEQCKLSRVEQVPPVQVARESSQIVALKELEAQWRPGDEVHVETDFRGIDGAAFVGDRTVKENKPAIMNLPNRRAPKDFGDNTVEIEFRLEPRADDKSPQLRVQVFAYPQQWVSGKFRTEKAPKTALSEKQIADWRKASEGIPPKAAKEFLAGWDPKVRAAWLRFPPETRRQAIYYQRLEEEGIKLTQEKQHWDAEVRRLTESLEKEKDQEKRDKLGERIASATQAVESKKMGLNRVQARVKEANFSQLDKKAREDGSIAVQGRVEQAEQYEQAVLFAAAAVAWCDAMQEFLADLVNQGRFHYRVYLQTSDGPIDVEITEGFSTN